MPDDVYYVLRSSASGDYVLPAGFPGFIPVDDAYPAAPGAAPLFERLRADFECLVFKVTTWDEDGRPEVLTREAGQAGAYRLVAPVIGEASTEPL